MSAIETGRELCQKLKKTFGERVRFDEIERRAYARDAGDLPDLLASRIENEPDAVIQPASEAEVVRALDIAAEFDVPVVPRGSGTSGYGGALPIVGGLVLHFARMDDIRRIDRNEDAVVVGPGVVWDDLQAALLDDGLELPLYPTSAAGSTVAGWVAEGGAGIGSAANGTIGDHLRRVRLVTPDGERHELRGEDISQVLGAEGSTGVITEVELSVTPREEKHPFLLAYDDLSQATEALRAVASHESVFHAGIFNPAFARAVTEIRDESLPERYLVLAAVTGPIDEEIQEIATRTDGQVLDHSLAEAEWAERLRPLQFKQDAPSLIPAETVVPISTLDEAIDAYEATNDEFRIEGHAIGGEEVAILGFVPADAREAAYAMKWADSLDAMAGAEDAGGRAYTVGSYFIDRNHEILGDQVEDIEQFKRQHDPTGILNPGTVVKPERSDAKSVTTSLSRLMTLGSMGSAFADVGEYFVDLVGSDGAEVDLGVSHVFDDAFACASCAACTSTCTITDAQPWESTSPKGKWSILEDVANGDLEYDDRVSNLLHLCTTCKRCIDAPTAIGDSASRCMVDMEIPDNFFDLYAAESEGVPGVENPGLGAISDNVNRTSNFFGKDPERREEWVPEDVSTADEAEYVLWSSCWDSYLMPNRSANLARILSAADVTFARPEEENCCGLYNFLAGRHGDLAEIVQENVEMFQDLGASTLVVSCPGCTANFDEVYPEVTELLGVDWDVEISHVLEVVDDLIQSGELTFEREIDATVTYHDSCHVGRWHGLYDEPRRILEAIPGVDLVEMEHNREDSLCCGTVAGFSSVDVAKDVGTRRAEEAMETGADTLVTNCSGCGVQLNGTLAMAGANMSVQDITDLVTYAAGIETVETPNEHMLENLQDLLGQLEGRTGEWMA